MRRTAWNKGKKSQHVLDRVNSVRQGLGVECKKHGLHDNWSIVTLSSGENVTCNKCRSYNESKRLERNNELRRLRKIKHPLKFLLQTAKNNAKRIGREFKLTEQDLELILKSQNNSCTLSGVRFNKNNLPSLDRKDSSRGYVRDNVQLVTVDVNYAKQSLNNEQFIKLCEQVATNRNQLPVITNMQALANTVLSNKENLHA